MLRLERALVSFDLETTGLDVGKDRIVEIGMVRVERDGTRREWVQRVNPGIPIPREATAVHGIRDEDVREMPSFSEVASTVVEMMMDADLAGYNSNRFDVPMLAEELLRAGHPFDISDRRCVDAMVIFMKHEERTLEAAMRFYCGKEIPKAHCALDDARAALDVLYAEVERYDDLSGDMESLAKYSEQRKTADFAGKLLYDAQGEVVLSFGKYKNRRIRDLIKEDVGYLHWMLGDEFPEYTKHVISRMLEAERG